MIRESLTALISCYTNTYLRLHCEFRTLRLTMSRIKLLEFNFEDNINEIFYVYLLLVNEGGKENGYIIGG